MLGAEEDPKHITLPPEGEREWLLGSTTKLLASVGWQAYVRAPLLEPSAEFFPDRWAGGEPSVRRLLVRLLRYAGHPEFQVAVVIHDADPARRGEVLAKPAPMRNQDPVAWFVRRDKQTLHFACEQDILREPENLVPALARAVAHAYRVIHKLDQPDNQRLIDVTGFALGFGLLTTDACQRFYAKSAGGMRTTRAQFRLGALSVQDMSFLLAVQLEARADDRKQRKQWLGRLQPNQAGFAREAGEWLVTVEPPIRTRLGIPSVDQWPPAPNLRELVGPPVEPEAEEPDESGEPTPEARRDEDHGIRAANRSKPVFRIERSAALRMAKLLGLPILLLGALFSRGGNYGIELPTEYIMPSAILLAVAGLAIGSLFTDRRCSEPKCGHKLTVKDEVCPLCGGIVMGVIHHPRERLGAEEELTREGKISAEGLVVGRGAAELDEDEDDEDEDEDDEEAEGDEVEPNETESRDVETEGSYRAAAKLG